MRLAGPGGPGVGAGGPSACVGSKQGSGGAEAGVQEIIISLRRKEAIEFFHGCLPGPISAEAAEETNVSWGGRRW